MDKGFIIVNALSILGLNRFIIQIIYLINKYKEKIWKMIN